MKNNYHIAALGGGALVLVGLGYFAYSSNQAVAETLTMPTARPGGDVTSEGKDLADEVHTLLTESDPVIQRTTPDDRPVNLFTSVDLFIRPGNPNDLIDILKVDPIHPPIPNDWWVDNQLDPTMSDAPFLDADGDGFTNLEEYNSGTDPSDPSSIGDLVSKLEVAEIESNQWRMQFVSGSTTAGAAFEFGYLPHGGSVQKNEIPGTDRVQPGELFFSEEPAKERFKLVEVFEHPQEKTPTGQPQLYAKLEDQLENKQGRTYEIPLDPSARRFPDRVAKEYHADFTVVFRLAAMGEENNPFKVPENGTFSLPAGQDEKPYQVTGVEVDAKRKPVSVTVEYGPEGDKKTLTLPTPAA